MSRIDTSIARDDAVGRLKTENARLHQTITALQTRCEALVTENLAKSKEIVALEDTTALTPKKAR
jgi:hypothetical protein